MNSDDQQMSALEHNIKSKGEMSYYYAHGRKFENKEQEQGKVIEGPGIITGGDPVLLQKTLKEIPIAKEPKKFTKYIFYDDDKFVVVKIDLPEEIKDIVTDENIELNLGEKTLDLKVTAANLDPYILSVKKLNGKIVPEESKSKIFKGKLSLNLKKKDEDEEWSKLTA